MTELVRRVWKGLPGIGTPEPALSVLEQEEPAEALRVALRLPRQLYGACADELSSSLTAGVTQVLGELGIERPVSIGAHKARSGTHVATASIDGRPVAHVDAAGLAVDEAAAALGRVVSSRILRRLHLLQGEGILDTSTTAYLTWLGCRVPAGTSPDLVDVEQAERLIDGRSEEAVVLEVAAESLRRVQGQEQQALVGFREDEYRRRGVLYPDVRLVLADLPPGSVRLRMNDVTLPVAHLGEDAGWAEIVHHLGQELSSRRHWFVRMRDVAGVLDDDLAYVVPDLVAVTEANYPRPLLTACMRELVRSGRRMRNFPRITWMLLDQGRSPTGSDVLRLSESPLLSKSRYRPRAERDPMVLAARVRKMAAEEAWRLGNYRMPGHAVRLAPHIEERLVAETGAARARAEWAAVRALAAAPDAQRVITRRIEAIGPVRDAVQGVENVPRVMASQELPPDVDLSLFPVLGSSRQEASA